MIEKLTQKFIEKYPPINERTIIRDSVCPYLLLRIEPSGKKNFYVDLGRLTGKRAKRKIGDATIITPNQARDYAGKVIAEIKLTGENPYEKKKGALTVKEVRDIYAEWVKTRRKSSRQTMKIIDRMISDFEDDIAEELDYFKFDRYLTGLKENGLKAATINRRRVAFIAMINWAVRNKKIKTNPLAGLPKMKEVDSRQTIRFLSDEERKRLVNVALAKEDLMRPLIMLALNTGIRKGALFALRWSDIDFVNKTITLRADAEKTERTTIVPINKTAVDEILAWKEKNKNNPLVLPSPVTGGVLDNVQKAWETILKQANITNFRFHDLRHDFASRLVQKGVPLIVVRDLLGHTDIKTTQKYAHLAPSDKAKAVEMLG